jgi:hypothetical protein
MLFLLSRQAAAHRRYGQSGKLDPLFFALDRARRDEVRRPGRRSRGVATISILIL